MPCSHKEVEILVNKLEHSLRQSGLWSTQVPSAKALQSMVPFAYDSMQFEQWLQFIFIPKMLEILDREQSLPKNLQLLPMAELSIGDRKNCLDVMGIISQIDLVFAQG